MNNEFEIIIGADGRQVTQTLGELQADFKNFTAQLQNTKGKDAIESLNKSLATTKANIALIKNAGLGKELDGIRPGANQATNAMINLGRVASDLPYGFVGIANNLNPLLESFQRLGTGAGGLKASLLALGSSLVGAGGIGLAVAAIPAAIQIVQNGIVGFGKKTKETKKEVEDFTATMRDSARIQQDSAASIESEVIKVRTLASAIEDVNRSNDERRRALQELKALNKSYFGDLSLEKTSLDALRLSVDQYTQSLLNQAVTKSFGEDIGKGTTELVKQKDALTQATAEWEKSVAARDKLNAPLKKNSAGFSVIPANTKELREEAGLLDERRLKLEEEDRKYSDLVGNLTLLKRGFTDAITEGLKFKSIDFVPEPKEKKITEEKLPAWEVLEYKMNEAQGKMWANLEAQADKSVADWYQDMARSVQKQDRIQKVIDALNHTNEAIKNGIVSIPLPRRLDVENAPVGRTSADLNNIEREQRILAKYKDLNLKAPDLSWLQDAGARVLLLSESLGQVETRAQLIGSKVQEVLAPAFSSLFSSLISGSQNALQAFSSFFKQILVQIASTIAQAAVLALVLSAITGGGSAAAAGGKGGFGNIFKSLLGIGKGPGLGYEGFGHANQQVEFVISGQNLVGTLNRAGNNINRRGG